MDTLDRTTITTTYAGETLFLAAAKTVMEIMNREPVIEHLFAMGERLKTGFDSIFQETNYPAKTVGLAPAITINFEDEIGQHSPLRAKLFDHLYNNGVFANKEWLINYSHQPQDIDQTLEVIRQAVKAITK